MSASGLGRVSLKDGTMIYGAVESDTFFSRTYYLLEDGEATAFPIPKKASLGADYEGWQFVTLARGLDGWRKRLQVG